MNTESSEPVLVQPLRPPPAEDPLPCRAPFATPMIRRDGRVTVCPLDLRGELVQGDLAAESLDRIWNGAGIRALRLAHLRGDGLPPLCAACPRPDRLPLADARAWLAAEGLRRESLRLLARHGIRPRLLLVNPPVSERAPFKSVVSSGLGYLAAAARDLAEVAIVDLVANHEPESRLLDYIERRDFHIVGWTAMTYQAKAAMRLGRAIRERFGDRLVVAGGVFASARPDEALLSGGADAVVLREGEETLRDLIEALARGGDLGEVAGIRFLRDGAPAETAKRARPDVMRHPTPARDLMPDRGFLKDDPTFGEPSCELIAARGCPGACIFCETPHQFGTRVRSRTVESVIEEIRDVVMLHGVRCFAIDDDAFTADRAFALAFCDRVADLGLNLRFRVNTRVNLVDAELLAALRHAGCVKVTFGVESGDDGVLAALGKGFTVADVERAVALCREATLPAACLFIIGNPLETEATVRASMALAKRLAPAGGTDFQIMQPHPGTALGDRLHAKYGTLLSRDWDDYYSDNITFVPHGFSPERFLELCREATGRPVQLAGEHAPARADAAPRGTVATVDPERFSAGLFDLFGPHVWSGDETYRGGLAHVLGGRSGFLEYRFDLPDIPRDGAARLAVACRASSQIPRKRSLLRCTINGVPVGEAWAPEKSAAGERIEFACAAPDPVRALRLAARGNLLRLEVPAEGDPAGLSLFSRPLSRDCRALAQGIEIAFRPRPLLARLADRAGRLFRRGAR